MQLIMEKPDVFQESNVSPIEFEKTNAIKTYLENFKNSENL